MDEQQEVLVRRLRTQIEAQAAEIERLKREVVMLAHIADIPTCDQCGITKGYDSQSGVWLHRCKCNPIRAAQAAAVKGESDG